MKDWKVWLETRMLQESMDLYIKGHDTHNQIDDVDDLAHYLKYNTFDKMWSKMTPEEQEEIRKGGSMHHWVISPDGSFYKDGTPVINFYTTGFTPERKKQMLQGIEFYLKELGIPMGQIQTNTSNMYGGEVIRIPIGQIPKKDTPARLNMSNQNAITIFRDLLNYPEDPEGGFFGISAADLLIKIDNLPDYMSQVHQRDPYDKKGKTGPRMIDFGLSADAIQQRLDIIRQIAQWAVKNGHSELYVA